MMKFLKDPLFHFLILGACLFALYEFTAPASDNGEDNEVFISEGQINALVSKYEKTWNRPPNQEELSNLVDNLALEEMYYREAKRLKLDENDLIIRRRLMQKLEFFQSSLLQNFQPDDEQLIEFFNTHRDRYISESRFSFQQITVHTERSPEQLAERIAEIQSSLTNQTLEGDRSLLPKQVTNMTGFQVDRVFGKGFSKTIAQLPLLSWSEPIRSGLALHFIFLEAYKPGSPLSFEEARKQVLQDWLNEENLRIKQTLKDNIRQQYRVVIQQTDATDLTRSPTTATTEPGED